MQQFEALSDDDLIAFRKHLAIYGHGQLQSLFEYLVKYRHGPENRLTKQRIFEKLFPLEKSSYNDARLRNILSRLGQQLEDFLIQLELDEDEGLKRELLVRAYKKRNAYALFKLEISTRIRKLEAQRERGIAFFRECATLLHHQFFHSETNGLSKSGSELYTRLVQHFEGWFTLGMLSYQGDFLVRKGVLKEESPSQYINAILDKGGQVLPDQPNLVAEVLSQICKLEIAGLSFEELDSVCHVYHEASANMEAFERNMALKALILFVSALIATRGDDRLFNLLFDLYKDGLETGIYVEEGRINSQAFVGIAIVGAGVGKLEWTEAFIGEYGPMIEEDKRKDALSLAEAYFRYNCGRKASGDLAATHFEAAIMALRNIQHGQPDYELRVRSLQLRIFYDFHLAIEKNDGLLNDFSKNFRQYLYNMDSRLALSRTQAYLDFINYALRLARLHALNVRNPLVKLKKIVADLEQTTTQVMLRHWLMEKAEELRKLLR